MKIAARIHMLMAIVIFLIIIYILYVQSGKRLHGNVQSSLSFLLEPPERIKVITYNIRGGRTEQGLVDLLSIARELQSYDPDIIALQEVDIRLPRTNFQNQVKFLSQHLNMNYLFAPNLNFVIGSYGNAILSKFPITGYDYIPLPSHREPRGILKAEIQIGSHAVDVFTTHLGLAKEEQAEQIHAISSIVSGSSSSKLLLGDFNMKPHEELIQSLRLTFIDPVYENNLNIVTYEHPSIFDQIDYIFMSKDFTFEHAYSERSATSDHNPLMYSLRLPLSAPVAGDLK